MFTFRATPTTRVQQMLRSLQSRGGSVVRDVAAEVNRRHALAMRRKRIPRDTGRLEDSLTLESHPDRVVRVTTRTIEIGTRVPYAQYQESRIGKLTQAEIKEIVAEPIAAAFNDIITGGR